MKIWTYTDWCQGVWLIQAETESDATERIANSFGMDKNRRQYISVTEVEWDEDSMAEIYQCA